MWFQRFLHQVLSCSQEHWPSGLVRTVKAAFGWLTDVSLALSPGQPLYVMLYAAAIIFFCFFYTALVFNPRETADNLKKSGAFVPGIRPGEQTAKYIDKVMTRLTFSWCAYTLPLSVWSLSSWWSQWNVRFYFGGTSLLIVVVVIMDFMAQVQTHMMSNQYESVLKKRIWKATAVNSAVVSVSDLRSLAMKVRASVKKSAVTVKLSSVTVCRSRDLQWAKA